MSVASFRRLGVGRLVAVGKGKRVYRVRHVFPDGRVEPAADAKHPDALQWVTDEFRVYRLADLNEAAS